MVGPPAAPPKAKPLAQLMFMEDPVVPVSTNGEVSPLLFGFGFHRLNPGAVSVQTYCWVVVVLEPPPIEKPLEQVIVRELPVTPVRLDVELFRGLTTGQLTAVIHVSYRRDRSNQRQHELGKRNRAVMSMNKVLHSPFPFDPAIHGNAHAGKTKRSQRGWETSC
jgi:hypothetical protein